MYLKVDDIPHIYNYIALYGAIKSKKEISAGEALNRVGIGVYGGEIEELEHKELEGKKDNEKRIKRKSVALRKKEQAERAKMSQKNNKSKEAKTRQKDPMYRYMAFDNKGKLLAEGSAKEVAEKIRTTVSTVRTISISDKKLRGKINITREREF